MAELLGGSVLIVAGREVRGSASLRALLLFSPTVPLVLALLPLSVSARQVMLLLAMALVLVQCGFLIFSTGPIYPLIFMLIAGAWWVSRPSSRAA